MIMIRIANKIRTHPDFKTKYADNPDAQNAAIAFNQIFEEVMASNRKNELDLYRLIAKDDAFRVSMLDTLNRCIGGVNSFSNLAENDLILVTGYVTRYLVPKGPFSVLLRRFF